VAQLLEIEAWHVLALGLQLHPPPVVVVSILNNRNYIRCIAIQSIVVSLVCDSRPQDLLTHIDQSTINQGYQTMTLGVIKPIHSREISVIFEKKLMEPDRQIEIRSDEVQEIITQVPHALTRWGITVIFLVMVALGVASWVIKYPDILMAEVVITTNPAPVTLVSRVPGKITLLKQDKEKCDQRDLIGYIQSNASVTDVLRLEDWLKKDEIPDDALVLGDLQPAYSAYAQAFSNLRVVLTTNMYGLQIKQLEKQLATFEKLGKALTRQEQLALQELLLARQKFDTDSVLFVQKVTSALDYNQAKASWLQQQRQYRNAETSVLNNELQIHQLRKQIADLNLNELEQYQKLSLSKENARRELESRISSWKDNS
jgi:HlyD family secretion protein